MKTIQSSSYSKNSMRSRAWISGPSPTSEWNALLNSFFTMSTAGFDSKPTIDHFCLKWNVVRMTRMPESIDQQPPDDHRATCKVLRSCQCMKVQRQKRSSQRAHTHTPSTKHQGRRLRNSRTHRDHSPHHPRSARYDSLLKRPAYESQTSPSTSQKPE